MKTLYISALTVLLLASYIFLVEGQTTSVSDDLWRVVTCNNTQLHLAIETRGCELTLVGRACVTRLQELSVIKGVCTALSDGVTYECLVNTTYTDPVCCLLYEEGSSKPVSNSCIPIDTTSTEGTEATTGPTDTRTASTEQPDLNNTSPELPPMVDVNDEYNHPTWIAGVITVFIVLVAFVVFVVGLIIWWYRRRSKRDDQQNRRHRDGAPMKNGTDGDDKVKDGGEDSSKVGDATKDETSPEQVSVPMEELLVTVVTLVCYRVLLCVLINLPAQVEPQVLVTTTVRRRQPMQQPVPESTKVGEDTGCHSSRTLSTTTASPTELPTEQGSSVILFKTLTEIEFESIELDYSPQEEPPLPGGAPLAPEDSPQEEPPLPGGAPLAPEDSPQEEPPLPRAPLAPEDIPQEVRDVIPEPPLPGGAPLYESKGHTQKFGLLMTPVVQRHVQNTTPDVQEPVTCQQKDKIVEEDVSSVSSVAQDQQSCVVSDGQETSPVEKVRMGGNTSSAVPHTAPVEKVRMGGNTSSAVPHTAPVEKVRIGGNTSSAVPREQQSRFKTDDQTCGSVSRIKKFQFVPALFGAVVVAITCILTLATCVHTDPAAVLHPTLAGKYRWLDRGSPWIAWIGDRYLSYPHEDMFHPPNHQPALYCVVTAMTLTVTMTLTLATCIQHYQTRLTHSPPAVTAVNYWAFPAAAGDQMYARPLTTPRPHPLEHAAGRVHG
ncbi:uncharacterized protein LOC135335952 isoform X4 [Halichondria panicea]|uniref:uncharacterized protein LOC135335952 isoform X4 n=1 Tax=Halichondria panicea TaxID=6063 RepID=UPI00312BC04D